MPEHDQRLVCAATRASVVASWRKVAKLVQVTAIEQEVKKVNFTLLVRVKNQLDPEQQAKFLVSC